MKRLLSFFVISALLVSPSAFAATKKPTVKALKLLTSAGSTDEFAGVVTSGKTIVIFGNKGDKSFARAIDSTGTQLWNIALDPSSASIATAAAVDNSGTVWIAGSTSLQRPMPTPTASASPLNPDQINPVPDIFSADLDAFSLWSINPITQSMTQYTYQLKTPVLINALVADKAGLTAVGSSGFIVNADLKGQISKPIYVGTEATNFESVVRNIDGTITAVGSSSETLGGKKLVGKVDGIIVKVSKLGKITNVVRSSATKALRSWANATSTLLLGGEVMTNAKIESSVTKFSTAFVPTWTYRFASTGSTYVSGNSYAFFQSTSAISNFTNWAPKIPQALLVGFDAKGAINAGYSAPIEQNQVLGLSFSKDLGLLCITASAETVSIFTLN